MTARVLLVLAVGVLLILTARLFRKVPPDRCLVFFSGGKNPVVQRIVRSGLVFAPPWSRVGTLYLGALAFELESPGPQALRFLVGAETEGRGLNTAAERLTGMTAPELVQLARKITGGQLEGMRPGASADRTSLERNVAENIRMALAAKGLRLLSCNLDGLFGDAPGRF